MYVARWTSDPKKDIKRGWSGWQSGTYGLADLRDFLSSLYITDAYDEDELTEEFLEELAEQHDVMWDEGWECWRQYHHDGLSCYALSATTPEDAAKEALDSGVDGSGFGQATVGTVTVVSKVSQLSDDGPYALYIFECEDVVNEQG